MTTIISILLALITGFGLLTLCHQYRYLNWIEQLPLAFSVGLSLSIFELFIEGIMFDQLSLVPSAVTCFMVIILLLYQIRRQEIKTIEIQKSINITNIKVWYVFKSYTLWKKIAILFILCYCIVKVVMSFVINIHMPTVDEDSVTGWDMKSKIFIENRSLMLDSTNEEFLGTSTRRNIYAPLIDFYLNSEGDIAFYNILSPLVYTSIFLLLFGLTLRKTNNLLLASLVVMMVAGMPFLFIHGISSYINLPGGLFVFMYVIYAIDYILYQKDIVLILAILGFLASILRNESFYIIALCIALILSIAIARKYIVVDKKSIIGWVFMILGLALGYLSNQYIQSFIPGGVDTLGVFDGNPIQKLISNISQRDILLAPLDQSLYHPDYNLLYVLFIIAVVVCIINYKKLRKNKYFIVLCAVLFLQVCVYIVILYSDQSDLGLVSHNAFIRYSLGYILFLIYFVLYVFGSTDYFKETR